MSDTFAIQRVLDAYSADIDRRNILIREHVATAARLEADNLIDAHNAEVAAALIEQINADALATSSAPTTEVAAAALVADHVLIGGMPRQGKSAARTLLLAALRDAVADITAVEGPEAASFVHDHAIDDCPACLLTGAGDLAMLDAV